MGPKEMHYSTISRPPIPQTPAMLANTRADAIGEDPALPLARRGVFRLEIIPGMLTKVLYPAEPSEVFASSLVLGLLCLICAKTIISLSDWTVDWLYHTLTSESTNLFPTRSSGPARPLKHATIPPSIRSTTQASSRDKDCAFCRMVSTYTAICPLSTVASLNTHLSPDLLPAPHPLAYPLLSTPDVIAFLDIAPLTRGHALLIPRRHCIKTGGLMSAGGSQIGAMLPLLSRSVMRAVFPHADPADADYNIVQNNGEGADQVVPHVHFHVVPRPRDHYQVLDHRGRERYTRRPPGAKALAFMFGRGGRAELVETEARALMDEIRGFVREEWGREFGGLEEWREGEEDEEDEDEDSKQTRKGIAAAKTKNVVSRPKRANSRTKEMK